MTLKQNLSSSRRNRLNSFTLVELLVVIGIIAILAAVLLSAGGAALRAAMRLKALNLANQIQTSTMAYYNDYNTYPVPITVSGKDYTIADTDQASWSALIPALCGNVKPYDGSAFTPSTITNSRGIPYLSLKSGDVDSQNAPVNALPTTNGNKWFFIAMDSDYDGVLGTNNGAQFSTAVPMPSFATGSSSGITGGTATTGVAVWANCNNFQTSTNKNYWIHTY